MTHDKTAPLSKEIELVLLLIKLSFEPQRIYTVINCVQNTPIDWENVYEIAKIHKIRPLILRGVNLLPKDLIPQAFLSHLEAQTTEIIMRSLRNTKELLKILSLLKQHNIPVIPYKGSYFAKKYYGTYNMRETIDVDIFVYEKDIPQIIDVFKTIDYTPHFPLNADQLQLYLNLNNDYNFQPVRQGSYIEPHFKSNIPHSGTWFTLDTLMPYTEDVIFENTLIKAFNINAELLLLITHHGIKEGWTKLKYLVDFYALLKHDKGNIDWNWLLKISEEKDFKNNLLTGVALLKHLWQIDVPLVLDKAIDNPVVQKLKHDRLQTIYLNKGADVYFNAWLFNVKSRQSVLTQLRIILSIIFKPSAGDIVTLQLPTWLYFAYYFIRPFRLLKLFTQNKFMNK
jgi:Uncharacterised nucleotidyltransferase